jgi:two-component system nitrate/nitrite response regulator NarL
MSPSPAKQGIRICLLDDHKIYCEALAGMLGREPGIEVVGRCQTAAEALEVLGRQEVDLFLVDLWLEHGNGFDFLERLDKEDYNGRVVVLAERVEDADAVRLARLGVSGIVLKTSVPDLLTNCIRAVAAGEPWFSPGHLQAVLHSLSTKVSESGPVFTDREKDVLRSLLQGLGNKEIAARMGIPETTVKFLIQKLFRKVGVHSRSQLVLIALEEHHEQLRSD